MLLLPMMVPPLMLAIWFKQRERRAKRLGIQHHLANSDLLRPAAYSTSNALDDERWIVIEALMQGMLVALMSSLVLNLLAKSITW